MRAVAAILALGSLGVAAASPATAQPARPHAQAPADRPRAAALPRDGIEALETQLDRAVDLVSLPRPVALLGREAARGYRLPGYGVVFVLTPRTLPGFDGLDALRSRQRIELRRVRSHSGEAPDEVGALERQVIVLQQETEQARRAAEEDMERIVHDVRVRLAAPEELHVEVGPAPAPATPDTPRAPAPAEAPLPPPPPWKFWFDEAVPHDTRTPDAVVADVRRVLVEALETDPGRVPGLAPEEFVTVAVDFEPAGLFARRVRPERTLVVRARVRDIEARAKGAIASDELRRRVEVIEY
jgi:hypothetical protein